ncbi:MAG: hypothetical protein IIB87_04145, partial [Chloroflexi bacterium]|nr:hypothetical protein [Chloroflexota bacterium]
ADWYEVRRGELFEAHGQVEIGFMSSLDKPVADIRAFLDVAEALGLDESIDLPDKEIQQMEAVATTARERSVPFVFYLNGSKTCRAVGELVREHLRVSTSRVSGEFTVFLKVTGMIEKGETFDMTGMIGDIINLGASANRKQRRASRKARLGGKSKSNDDPKFTLKGPALKVTPYAIVI